MSQCAILDFHTGPPGENRCCRCPPKPSGCPGSEIVRDTLGLPVVSPRGVTRSAARHDAQGQPARPEVRYKVFYEEMGQRFRYPQLSRRDKDAFDRVCDHLLVYDMAHQSGPLKARSRKVVRYLPPASPGRGGSELRFLQRPGIDIAPLLARHPHLKFLELGRSCVLKPYRTKEDGGAAVAGHLGLCPDHRIDVMFGCASLEGTNPLTIREELAFLQKQAGAKAIGTRRRGRNARCRWI